MQLNFSSTPSYTTNTSEKTQVRTSYARERSSSFSSNNDINALDKKVLVESYFKIFDKSYSEVTIKNLIAARLQPSAELKTVHDTQLLSLKAKELLDFSLSV